MIAPVPPPIIGVADVTPSSRQGGRTRALLTPKSAGATSGFLGTTDLEPGEWVSEHYHPYSDKYLYVVTGSVVVTINGHEAALEEHQAVLITRGQRNRIENRGEVPARFVFQISPLAPRPELGHVDTEPVPNPGEAPPKVGGVE
ncbi:cupin domain-containing protein [Streptomyces abikoensis]|uniref:cupin domain-containing protein n=1 Tax=Streptomyces abikoensis TaxID=97398 RepID=UPI001677A9E8|nr:cupin domain-containing protein [Streptomyces abikoensis]GGP51287.1 cupin [Streptomyces abikoensis]